MKTVKTEMKAKKLNKLRIVAGVVLSMLLAGPSFAAASATAAPRPVAAEQRPAVQTQSQSRDGASSSGTQSYAQRESAAQQLETWKGGHAGVYIGGSTLGIVLLVILLILIL